MARRAASGALLEVADVVHQHLGVIHLGAFRLQVGAVDALHVVAVEDRGHGLDLLERAAQAFDQRLVENAGMESGFVAVLFENVPAAELQIFDLGERNEVLDFRRVVVGALAEADRIQLRDGADRLRHAQFDGFNAGDKCRGDGAHARDQNAKFPVGWLDGGCGLLSAIGR